MLLQIYDRSGRFTVIKASQNAKIICGVLGGGIGLYGRFLLV
jgi:hypothetical protein